jgi:phage terminase large subunit
MSQQTINVSKTIGGGYNRFWHNKNFYRAVKGSRGSKKSKTTAVNIIYRMMKHSWANTLVVRRFSNTLKQSAYTDLKWAINKLGVSHLWKTNEGLPELTYKPTGQKIIFRGLDDPLKITSITVTFGILSWAWFEEAYEIESEDKFRTVVESIRGSFDSPEFFKQVTVTFNPWSERHWLKRVFFDEETQEDDTFAITTTFRVNEWLDDQDRKRYTSLYRTNPRRARIVCDGEWGIAEGLIYENFEIRDFNPAEVISRTQTTSNGLDFGYSQDPSAFVAAAIDLQANEIYIYDELYEKGLSNQKIYERLKVKGFERSTIIADSSEPKSIDELKRLGLIRVKGAAKGKDSIMHGVQFIQNFRVIIHPRCVHFIEEINNYVYDKDREGNTLNKPIDEFNHLMDALRYAMEAYSIEQEYTNIILPTIGGWSLGKG